MMTSSENAKCNLGKIVLFIPVRINTNLCDAFNLKFINVADRIFESIRHTCELAVVQVLPKSLQGGAISNVNWLFHHLLKSWLYCTLSILHWYQLNSLNVKDFFEFGNPCYVFFQLFEDLWKRHCYFSRYMEDSSAWINKCFVGALLQ